ncbi:MAG: sodium/proline symporter [Phycisphaeraceae bacterium]|nr:sodium/proline symporter [Phycisphaeraceae bacterium]
MEGFWKLLAIVLYAGILLVIGFVASKRTRTIRDYFASDKRLGFFNVAFSARATGESAWLLLGLTGMGYALGAQAFWVVLGELLGVGGAWILMSRRFKRLTDQYDSITIPDYLESRLRDSSHVLRLIAAGTLLIFVPIYAAAQVFATGAAFNDFLGWDHILGAAAGFGIVMLYVTSGGFTAVVWSDVFQGSLMLIGLVVLPIVAALHFGGVVNVADALRAIDPHLLSLHGPGEAGPSSGGWNTGTLFTTIGLAAIGIGFLGSPQVFVRFISLKNTAQILPGTITAVIWTIFADGGAVLVGMVGRAIYSPEALNSGAAVASINDVKENILPHLAIELLPAFFTGVFIAMVLSAIMSTIDSLLVVASSAGVRDYWQKVRHPEMSDERLLSLSRTVTIALSLIAFAVGLGLILHDREKPLFWIIIFGWSGIAATFCPVMILSLFWSGLTTRGAACGMIAGFVMVPIMQFAVPPLLKSLGMEALAGHLAALDVLLPAFAVGFVVAIALSLTDRTGRERVAEAREDLRVAGGK